MALQPKVLLIGIGLLAAAPLSASHSEQEDGELSERVIAALEANEALSMNIAFDLTRVEHDGTHQRALKADVLMATKRRVRIRVTEADREIAGLVCDGASITEWDHRARRWTKHALPDQALAAISARLWSGRPSLSDSALALLISRYSRSWVSAPSAYRWYLQRVQLADKWSWKQATVEGRCCNVLNGKRTQRHGLMTATEMFSLAFDPGTWLPVLEEHSTVVSTALPFVRTTGDSARRIRYTRVEAVPNPEDETFSFTPPDEYAFVEPGETLEREVIQPGQSIADWWVRSADGERLTLGVEAQRTGALVVITWTAWCAPCKQELRFLQELSENDEFRSAFMVLAVNVDRDPSRAIRKRESLPASFLVAHDPDFNFRLGAAGVPTTVVVDTHGVIRAIWTGWGAESLKDKLRSLLRDIAMK